MGKTLRQGGAMAYLHACRFRNTTLIILWSTFLVGYFDRVVMAVALPVFGGAVPMTALQRGAVLSALLAGAFLLRPLGDVLANRLRPRNTLALGLVLWSALTALTGIAAGFVQLCLVRLLLGATFALAPAAYWKLMDAWVPKNEWARAVAANLYCAPLAAALAPVVFISLLHYAGLQGAFFFSALPGLALAWIVWKNLYDSPAGHPAVTPEEAQRIRAECGGGDECKPPCVSLREVAAGPQALLLVLVYFVFSLALCGIIAWLPSYLVDVRKYSPEQMGLAVSIPFFAAFVAMFFGKPLCEKAFRGATRLFLAAFWAVGAVFLQRAYNATGETECLVYLSLATAFGIFMLLLPFWALPAKLLPAQSLAPACRLISAGGQVGGLVAPLLIGFLIDNEPVSGSYDMAFMLMEGCLLLAAALVLLVRAGKAE